MADIFISYAGEDAAVTEALAAALEARGWSVFWDRRIPTGGGWRSRGNRHCRGRSADCE